MKLRFAISTGLFLLTVILLLPSCVKDDLKELEENEKKIIDKYLSENNISPETKTEGGIYFIEKVQGTGLTPVKNDYIVVSYTGRYLENGDIRETNVDSLKSEWDMVPRLQNYLFGPTKIVYGYAMLGLNEALSLMKEGGKASAILPSAKANYDYRPLIYDLELIKVIREIQPFEDSVINVYSSKYYGPDAQIDTLGIWVRINEAPATTNIFGPGDSLFFNYTGKLVDGFGDSIVTDRIAESNEGLPPLKYIYGKTTLVSGKMLNNSGLLKGLKTAFDSTQITNGMKFSVLLKYNQAWDKAGLMSKQKYYSIPVYQNVEYDFEVKAIRPE